MFPNCAVIWISFSLGFSLRVTHLMPSNWHMECFTDGPASVTHVAVDDYLSHRCFRLYFSTDQSAELFLVAQQQMFQMSEYLVLSEDKQLVPLHTWSISVVLEAIGERVFPCTASILSFIITLEKINMLLFLALTQMCCCFQKQIWVPIEIINQSFNFLLAFSSFIQSYIFSTSKRKYKQAKTVNFAKSSLIMRNRILKSQCQLVVI